MCHFREVVWNRMGEVAFEVCPDILMGIKLRGIVRRESHIKARMPLLCVGFLSHIRAMFAAI
jgi:hypothetical protein